MSQHTSTAYKLMNPAEIALHTALIAHCLYRPSKLSRMEAGALSRNRDPQFVFGDAPRRAVTIIEVSPS